MSMTLEHARHLHELFREGGQPNIHPGLISSTGRGRVGTATSTQAAQLIGGGITPNMFTSPATLGVNFQQSLVLGNTSHYPVNPSLMIGDYVTPCNGIPPQAYRQ